MGTLSNLDELLLNPQVWTCSVAVPGTSRNNDSENREPTGDRSLRDPCPEAVFSTYHSGNVIDSGLEETHHTCSTSFKASQRKQTLAEGQRIQCSKKVFSLFFIERFGEYGGKKHLFSDSCRFSTLLCSSSFQQQVY